MPILQKVQNAFNKKDKESGSSDVAPAPEPTPSTSTAPASPVFDDKKITAIYVLGGPGAGKSTGTIRPDVGLIRTQSLQERERNARCS